MIDKEFEDKVFEIKLDTKWFDQHLYRIPAWADKKLEEQIATYKAMCLKDHSIAHPMMKQQYTYKDLESAYNAGIDSDRGNYKFESWYKNQNFEMTKENGTG